ncbi:hypothetical protein PHMEG_00019576 [Phytophthora megakarya]|uniref:Uncharacterized protein n=1 Tax=Phytophthora megakarya TaxID=4795 RepID=A0A225VTU2_9STRA|nr:hypothetical protein PHMEG_00019576 [Phytophthora megakarya]
MVLQFFKLKTEPLKREYISIAACENNITLLRWLVEHGTSLDINSAIILASKNFVEMTWWLSEEDRVTLVCKALQEEWYSMLKWVLEKTIFNEESSHHALRSAIGEASREIVKRLSENPSSSITFFLSK